MFGVKNVMLCLDMRLVQRLRGERTDSGTTTTPTTRTRTSSSSSSSAAAAAAAAASAASRDRSKSVCVTSFRNKSPRDVSALKLLHRRASSAM